MHDFILGHERDIYTLSYFGALGIIALWEGFAPRREATRSLKTRWLGNFGIGVIDIAIIQFLFPVMAVGFAILTRDAGIGLFNVVETPFWMMAVASILMLDFGRYIQHWLLHKVPLLWRLHRVHHADQDYDFTVGLRFHPLEGIFTTLFGFAVIAAIGAPPLVVAVSEAALAISGVFVHANARTWGWVESHLRLLLVTPDMHRVHHSTRLEEQSSNYSGIFSVWDRIMGTYVAEPAEGQTAMTIGLADDDRDPAQLSLGWMLKAPFMRGVPPARPVLVPPEVAE